MRAVGRFQLLARLASGALGELFVARELGTSGPPWAVQVIRPALSADLRFTRLLLTEANAGSRLAHPAAEVARDASREGEEVIVGASLVQGQTLAALLRAARRGRAPIDHRWICHIGAEVAAALAAAHALPWFPGAPAPMVHGAVAPRSIFVTYDGRVVLTGLGIGRARWAAPPSPSRLAYVAPERFSDRDPTPRTDGYALAVVLYDAFTGRRIFLRATDEETRAAIREANVPPLHAGNLGVHLDVADLLRAWMAPRVEARPGDLTSAVEVLREAAGAPAEAFREALAAHVAERFSDERENLERKLEAAARAPADPSSVRPGSGLPARAPTEGPVTRDLGLEPRLRRGSVVPREQMESKALHAPSDTLEPKDGERPDRLSRLDRLERPDRLDRLERLERLEQLERPDRLDRLDRLGRYVLEGWLPSSGPRAIHRGRDPNLGRPVVLHVLDAEALEDPRLEPEEWVRLFKLEARLAARLDHPRLPLLLDAGCSGERLFAAYRFLPGVSLEDRLERYGPLSPPEVLRYGADWADALSALHRAGLVHGDVRATNLLLDPDRGGAILDLSLAHAFPGPCHPLARSSLPTRAPETVDGGPYGPVAEQFAFGAVLYRAVVGTRPFRGLLDDELRAAIRRAEPRWPRDLGLDLPEGLEGVLRRLLAKEPSERFRDFDEVGEALREVRRDGRTIAAQAAGPREGEDEPSADRGEPAKPIAGLEPEPLARALAGLALRARSLEPERERPLAPFVAAVARRLEPGLLELRAPIVLGLGRLLRSEGLGAEAAGDLVPPEVRPGVLALLDLWEGRSRPPVPSDAAVAFVVERYRTLARPPEGHGAQSPRRAVQRVRVEAERRGLGAPVVFALVEHLRDRLSALDLSGPLDDRVLVAGGTDDWLVAIEQEGFEVVRVANWGAVSAELERGRFVGAVLDAALDDVAGPWLFDGPARPELKNLRLAVVGVPSGGDLEPGATSLPVASPEALRALVRSWRVT